MEHLDLNKSRDYILSKREGVRLANDIRRTSAEITDKTSFLNQLKNIGIGTAVASVFMFFMSNIPGVKEAVGSLGTLMPKEVVPYLLSAFTVGCGVVSNARLTKYSRKDRKNFAGAKGKTYSERKDDEMKAAIEYEKSDNREITMKTALEEFDEHQWFVEQVQKNYDVNITVKDQTLDEAKAELDRLITKATADYNKLDELSTKFALSKKSESVRFGMGMRILTNITAGLAGMGIAILIPAIPTAIFPAFKTVFVSSMGGQIALLSTMVAGAIAGNVICTKEHLSTAKAFKKYNNELNDKLKDNVKNYTTEQCGICTQLHDLYLSLAESEVQIQNQQRVIEAIEERNSKKEETKEPAKELEPTKQVTEVKGEEMCISNEEYTYGPVLKLR